MTDIEHRLRRLLGLPESDTRPLQWQTLQWRDHAVIHVVREPELLALVIPLGDTGVPEPLQDLVREARAERDSRGLERLQIILAATRPQVCEGQARSLFAAGCRSPAEPGPTEPDECPKETAGEQSGESQATDPRAELRLVALDQL